MRTRQTSDAYLDNATQVNKTEILKETTPGQWDVYSTTAAIQDVLNRKSFVRQYSGATTNYMICPTGTCRESENRFDGYGRAYKKTSPIQSAYNTSGSLISQSFTDVEYYADGSLKKTTDGRGAAATINYNARGLTTNVSYSAPAGIQIPNQSLYEYDINGNRTKMTDGQGYVDYGYDTVSRMTSEKRTFSDFAGRYDLNYEYTVQNQLKKISYSTTTRAAWQNFDINYDYDVSGRLASVTGTPFASETNLANGFQYRAGGAMKAMTFGQGGTITATYNARYL